MDVEEALIWILVGLTALSALGVVAFQSPVRAASSFLAALLFAATLLLAVGRPDMSGVVLWAAGGGAGIVLLMTILLLNLSAEEAGARRYSVPRLISLLLVGYLGAALLGVVDGAAPLGERPALAGDALGRSLFEQHAALVAVAFLALAVAVPVALILARRRA